MLRRHLSEARDNYLMPAKDANGCHFLVRDKWITLLPKEPSLSDCCGHQMITKRTRLLDEKVADVVNGFTRWFVACEQTLRHYQTFFLTNPLIQGK